ncbi:protein ELYS-like [Pungitius pungitius]|uniref:protein ELYS-like n=1 Tax=Pungitius pungitius TaxID=134920 RepID=UPI002E102C98
MLDPESQWSEALASNNIRAVTRWLRRQLAAEGEAHVKEILLTFNTWVQTTSELAKKELLTLCLSCSNGLWMFLDRSSFHVVHKLLQRLSNLLTLTQWAKRQLGSAHIWHGMHVPCTVCRDAFRSSDNGHGCWSREHGALKQHIWLGRLVQWWAIMGLLPKYPDAHELKHITQMWKEMDHSHRKSLETPGWVEGEMERFGSLIQGMVTRLDAQHGCIWTSEDSTELCYPPPTLQALLQLVLVPHIDHKSVQAILMYFVLDMANFLQCKDDLLRSFCHAFTVSCNFSKQIRAFWMLDHGHVEASMELLLSPGADVPSLSWQHRCIIRCLLTRKQPQLALKYLHWTGPPLESVEDAKLCTHVLLQNSCVSEAWALLKRCNAQSDNMVMFFLQACNGFGLCAEALKVIPAGYNEQDEWDIENGTKRSQLALMKKGRAD